MDSISITSIAKYLIYFGLILLIVGGLLYFFSKIGVGINLGKLPGDILIKKENFTFYFPLATSIIISIILTIALNMFSKK